MVVTIVVVSGLTYLGIEHVQQSRRSGGTSRLGGSRLRGVS